MDRHERILQLVRMRGPQIPSQINKELQTNVLFASAMLSELVDRKVLRLSKAKIGGTPVYYLPGQEAKLEMLYRYLHEKERRAYDLLKDSKVLADAEQEPVVRVALREIKDFAFPLEVTLDGNTDIFWRWHLTSEKDAADMIRKMLNVPDDPPAQSPSPAQSHSVPTQAPTQEYTPPESMYASQTQPVQSSFQQTVPVQAPTPAPTPMPAPQSPQVAQSEIAQAPVPAQAIPDEQLDDAIEEVESEIEEGLSKLEEKEEKRALPTRPKTKPAVKAQSNNEVQRSLESKELVFPDDDDLFDSVSGYFKKNHIEILDIDVIRKGSELDFVIGLPTNIGSLTYFCKVKSKQRINDADLSAAYIQGQIKKMPILFLTFGELTKKAKQLLSTEFKTMFVKRIEQV